MNIVTTSLNLRAVLAAAALGVVACSLASVCTAADSTNPLQTTVKYADLKISTGDGAAALYFRIQGAARQVCLPFDRAELSSKRIMGVCVHKAIADAVAKVDQPALFAIYTAHNDQPTSIVLAAIQNR
jgi:UrcA family protein